MDKKLAPSMMCVDYSKFTDTIRTFEKNKIGYLHIDIMDGEFVPNYTLGTDFCRRLRSMTDIPLDVHLMITRPEDKIKWFNFQKGEYVSVHYESTKNIRQALSQVRETGAKPMLAISPATPVSVIKEVMDLVDGILIMTVNPGFAGQKLIVQTLDKIKETRKLLDDNGYCNVEIEVDGNVSFENAKKMAELGANIFVGGSSSIFFKDNTMDENIRLTYEAIK